MKNILQIIKLSKPLYSLVAIIAVLILFSALLQLGAPLISKFIVDEVVAKLAGKGGDINYLIVLISLAFGLNVLGLISNVVSERVGDHFAGRLRKFLTEKFYDKVLTLPQTYFDSEISGKIVNQLSRGITTTQGFFNTATNFILPTLVQSIFIIGLLAFYSIPIAFFTLILFPIYLTISYYSTVKWGKEEVKKNAIEDRIRGRMQEVISNIRLVKGFTNEKNEYKIASTGLTDINAIYARQSSTFHWFDFFRGLSLNIILFLVNLIVFYQTFTGQLTIGEMVLILQLINQARIPLFAMSFILTQVQMAEAGSKEYLEILGLESTETYSKKSTAGPVGDPAITFENVQFSYKTSEKIIRDVSFTIAKNETVALVGNSGAGKTTIINLILKFYDPTGGEIYLKDKAYSKLDHSFVRNNISLVFQENELFSTSIRENVAYGSQRATDKDVMKALQLANAYGFVKKLPNGIDSEVGERGIRLSGGQKQRIQIARAILKNAPILILDEATSSLDAKSEKEVQDGLENLMKNKLVIIIAHRFSTIQNVNKVLVIDGGKIVESGTPKELSKHKGLYAELLHYQIDGNKKLLEKFDLYQ